MERFEALHQQYLTSELQLSEEKKAREAADKYIVKLQNQLEAAKVRIEELDEENKDREPLYEIGKDVRLRFLEQAREPILFTNYGKLDLAAIERGNEAAHSGNGIADAALLSQIPHTLNRNKAHQHAVERGKTFKSLYLLEPDTYMQTTATNWKLREAIDQQATIRTVRSLNQGVDRPLKEKQSAMDAFEIIKMKYEKAKVEGVELNESEEKEVDRRLAVLQEFTKTIVEYDRRVTGKNGGKKASGTAY